MMFCDDDKNNVFVFRLLSNEEIVAQLKDFSNDTLKLHFPQQIGIAQGSTKDNIQLQIAPFLPLSGTDDLRINREIIALVYKPNIEIENRWKSIQLRVTSGLVLPDSMENNSKL